MLGFLSLISSGSVPARAAERGTIVAVVDDNWEVILPRLRAELVSAGFNLLVVRSPHFHPDRKTLEQLAHEEGAMGGLSLVSSQLGPEVWVVDRATGHTIFRDDLMGFGDRARADAVAVRVVETLRATLLQVENTRTITEAPEPNAPRIEANQEAYPSQLPAKPRAQVGLRLTAGAELGLLPSIEQGAALTLWLQRSAWRAELSGLGFGGSSAHVESMPAIGAHLQLYSGAARGCAVPRIGRAELPVCLGVELGVMRAEGFGAQMTDISHSLWGAIALGPALRLPVTQTVSLWLGADELVSFLRPGFNVRNLGTFYTAPLESTRIWAGCELRLR